MICGKILGWPCNIVSISPRKKENTHLNAEGLRQCMYAHKPCKVVGQGQIWCLSLCLMCKFIPPKKNKDVMLKFEGFIQIISIILNAFSSVGHNGISQFFLEYLTHCAISWILLISWWYIPLFPTQDHSILRKPAAPYGQDFVVYQSVWARCAWGFTWIGHHL